MGLRTAACPVKRLTVLTLNSGSSSLKFGVHSTDGVQATPLLTGTLIGSGGDGALSHITQRIRDAALSPPEIVGHRIVHGGPKLRHPCVLNAAALEQLEAATDFAPLHMPTALALIQAASAHFLGVTQMACFDTGFHSQMPDTARVLPLARELRAEGIERYGFHGLSCDSILHQLIPDRPDRVVIAHLGNGASVTAVKAGRSVDTSMGLTPAGGVMMGTRSGDLDPGVLLYLMRTKHFDAAQCEDFINHRSGLLGVSGLSSDMRQLHDAAASNGDAQLAIEMFCHSVRKQIAAMITVLDGIDLLVFTGGIGEHDAQVRASICSGLSWIGVRLDPVRNRTASGSSDPHASGSVLGPIHDSTSRCPVKVLSSQEDVSIARHAWALVGRDAA